MAMLQNIGDKAQCPIHSERLSIGRASDNDIVIEDKSVSSHHAVILLAQSAANEGEKSYVIEDLGSTNKTYVNNTAITNHKLIDSDVIKIGKTRLKFSSEDCEPPATDFEQTIKINKKSLTNFLFGK